MFKEFKAFIMRGNVLDLAVGIIIGAAFGKIVTTLVEVALILLVMSLVFNVVARWLVVGKGARTAAAH